MREEGQGVAEHRWIGFVVFKWGDLDEIVAFWSVTSPEFPPKEKLEVVLYYEFTIV